jgi:division protein CdvB (Snf7/Vps24/ESCRT-III family)
MRAGILLSALALVFSTSLLPALAHGDEDHEAEHTETALPASEAEIKRMETLIGLLQQLITMMNALKIQQGYAPVVTVPKAVVSDDHHEDDEMDMHHEEHSAEATTTTPVKALVIEVEPHNDKTHVHVRYVDKPEAMFFVTSDIDDTAGIVQEVVTKTGLTKEEIEKALTFMK